MVKEFIKKDKILKNCIPIGLEKIESRAELAYYRLIGVNNNIEMMDYGAAVYDDIPSLKRNKKAMVETEGYRPDEEELKDEELLEEFRQDRIFIEAAKSQ